MIAMGLTRTWESSNDGSCEHIGRRTRKPFGMLNGPMLENKLILTHDDIGRWTCANGVARCASENRGGLT
jgi:hypothetical protein